jgi:hypothetical protein
VTLLNFLPGPNGGIFQFPLERYSPDTFRGQSSNTPIPFITPSLVDQPKSDWIDHASNGPFDATASFDPVYAPWRSVVYRNVDTAFTYGDDNALFPHMPRNTPGYDPRAHQILGDWMVSIPAVRKNPQLAEYTYDTVTSSSDTWSDGPGDVSPQPYSEVPPGDPRYEAAMEAAEQRLAVFHTGVNPALPSRSSDPPYSRYLELGVTSDIIDPATVANPVCTPIPVAQVLSSGRTIPPPDHPDWIVTDTTQPSNYSPRRSDWASALVGLVPETGNVAAGCPNNVGDVEAQTLSDENEAISALQSVRLDALFRKFATTPVPYSLWDAQPGCDYSGEPQASSFTASSQPPWMAELAAEGNPPNGPIYSESPGAAVFKAICINCHGTLANSQGILALNLADMSGGLDIVADFRDGFMGPLDASAAATHRHLVFGPAAVLANDPDGGVNGGAPGPNWTGSDLTDDDNAARYMAWMALGGTKVSIPPPVLQIVQATPVLGQSRAEPPLVASANMLSTAKALCASMYTPQGNIDPTRGAYAWAGVLYRAAPAGAVGGTPNRNYSLIVTNGDAANWFGLCTYNPSCPAGTTDCVANTNRAPVHVIDPVATGPSAPFEDTPLNTVDTSAPNSVALMLDPSTYPANLPVGTTVGGTQPSLTQDNAWPWCVRGTPPAGYPGAQALPYCPAVVPTSAWSPSSTSARALTAPEVDGYAVRGAINAGLAAFTYVEGLEQQSASCPDYNQCPSANDAGVGAVCP